MIVKHVAPVSVAKVAGVLYAFLGLLVGVFFTLAALAGAFASNRPDSTGFGMVFGVGAIVIFPILYAVIGFIFSLIGAALYNVIAGLVGGVELDVQ